MKTVIVVDTSFYMATNKLEELNIHPVQLSINFENISFKEVPGDSKILDDVFAKLDKYKYIPKTSQPAAQDYLYKFEELKKSGYERIISLTVSSKLSGTFQGATIAAQMFMKENPDINVETYDSKLVAQGASIMTIDLAKMLQENPKSKKSEIENVINFYSKNIKIYLLVDSLDYLAYGGRFPSSIAAIGNIFGIKPVLEISNGEIKEYKKMQKKKKVLQHLIKKYETEIVDENPADYMALTTHVKNEKDAEKVMKIISSKYPEPVPDFPITELGPVLAIHVGKGAVGFGWTKNIKKRKNENSNSN